MAGLSRRQRTAVRTREEIVDASAEVFARTGFDAATMQDLARAARYSVPSLYAYFPSKRALYAAVVERLRADFAATFNLVLPAGLTFRQKLELLVRRQLEVAERRRDALLVLFAPGSPRRIASGSGPSGFAAQAAGWERWLGAATSGKLRGERAEAMAYAVTGVVYGFLRRWLEEGARGPLADQACTVSGLVLHGINGGAS